MNRESLWCKRYREAGEEYLFGTEPNHFLARRAHRFIPGSSALSVADGEGRNSIWLAEQGLAVTALEASPVALKKAHRLADERGVNVSFILADMLDPAWPPLPLTGAFDWVVGIFIQFARPHEQKQQFEAMQHATRPGGHILLLGYTPRQLEFRTGGPSSAENLYTEALLREFFAEWQIEELVEYEDEINEGLGHKGRSALIGLVAKKPM